MAAISFRRINRAALAEHQTHRKQVAITGVLYGIASILMIFSNDIGVGVGALFGVCGLLCGFVTALSIFKELNNKQLCDMAMSLPVTGRERFLSKILAYFYIQFLPLFGACVLSYHIAILLNRHNFTNRIKQDFSVYTDYWVLIVIVLSASLFILAIIALCSSCSGTIAEASYFSGLVLLIQALFPMCLLSRIFETISGVDWIYSHSMIWNFWGAGFFNAAESENTMELFLGAVINILISIVILIITMKIYEKRDARVVGTPIANKTFFELLSITGIFTIYTFLFFSNSAIWGILIAGVVYLIVNIIVSRKKIDVKCFIKWAIKFAVINIAFVAIMAASILTGGFGYIHTQPERNLDGYSCTISIDPDELYEIDDQSNYKMNVDDIILIGKKLTDAQCREILDIFQKHLDAGKPGLEILMKDSYFSSSEDLDKYNKRMCSLTINGKTEKERSKTREPGCRYDIKDNGKLYCYFHQDLCIDKEESKALTQELLQLPYLKQKKL